MLSSNSLELHQTTSLLEKIDPALPSAIHCFPESLADISTNLPFFFFFIHIGKNINLYDGAGYQPTNIFDIFTSLPKYGHFLKSSTTTANRGYRLCCDLFFFSWSNIHKLQGDRLTGWILGAFWAPTET